MPSLPHRVLARAIPVVRRAREVQDPERTRTDVLAKQARSTPAPPSRLARGLKVGSLDGYGFPVFDLRPPGSSGSRGSRTVLYLHGGGFVGDVDWFHWRYAARLARATGARVVLPTYPLTPTATWRDAHPPLLRLFTDLAVESPDGVSLAGDSAGGGLALALAQQVAAGAGPQPTHLVLVSPWVDLAGATPGTREMNARDRWLMLSKLELYGRWWAGADDPVRPEVSPLNGSYAGLPPTLVMCGTRDLLVPQVRVMVQRAADAGVSVTYREERDLVHVYPLLPVPEARAAFADVVGFLDRPRRST